MSDLGSRPENLSEQQRQLVVSVLQAQEERLKAVKASWRWWEVTLFVFAWAGFAWFLYQGLLIDAAKPVAPGMRAEPAVPFHIVVTLVVVPLFFLLMWMRALHRRMDAMVALLGDKALMERAIGEIRSINQLTEDLKKDTAEKSAVS